MGKFSKRLLSMLVIAMMVCAMLPFHALATDTDNTDVVTTVLDEQLDEETEADEESQEAEEEEPQTEVDDENTVEEPTEEAEESEETESEIEEEPQDSEDEIEEEPEEEIEIQVDSEEVESLTVNDAGSKVLIVDGSSDVIDGQQYQKINDAIAYIAAQQDKDGWTISIMPGKYGNFAINDKTITNITIVGAERQEEGMISDPEDEDEENAADDTEDESEVIITGSSTVNTSATIRNIKFIDNAYTGTIYGGLLAVGGNSPIIVDGCYFEAEQGTAIGAYSFADLTVNDSEFHKVGAFAINCDNEACSPENNTLIVTDNTVTDCGFFLHGCFSNLTVTGNTITGSEEAWTATLLSYRGSGTQTVTGNTFQYADFGYQNAISSNISTKGYLETNTFELGYVADEIFDYSSNDGKVSREFSNYETTYYAPEKEGYNVVWSADASDTDGYEKINDYLSSGHANENPLVVVRKDGEGPQFTMGLDYHGLTLSYEKTYGIKIFKYDQSDETLGLEGAQFELRKIDETSSEDSDSEATNQENDEPIATLTSDNKGYASIEGLRAGQYMLTETVAPEGYAMSNESITITVSADEVGEDNYVSVKFANTLIPHTGGSGTRMYTIIGVIIILAAGIIFVISRRKKKD